MTPPSSTYVVLGLLAKRSGSGYDVAAFADRSVRFFWPISRSQLYAELARLEEVGWASGTAVQQRRYPNKRVYEITESGAEALSEWLDDAPLQQGRTQDAMVLRTFLGSHMSPDRLAAQLREHREQAQRTREELSAVVGHLDDKAEPTESQRFGRASARYGVLQAEATIAWTEEVEALLEAERGAQAG